MKQLKTYFAMIVVAGFAVLLLLYPDISRQAVQQALSICTNTVLPALFPFFLIVNICLSLGISERISKAAAPLIRFLFHLPSSVATAFVLGVMGGYPIGAVTIAKLYTSGLITEEESKHSLLFCCNAGPAFIFGVLGGSCFQSVWIAMQLWMIHLLGAVFLGILFRPKQCAHKSGEHTTLSDHVFFSTALTNAVSDSTETTIRISAYVLFFSIICGFLAFLGPKNNSKFMVLLSTLEMAGGFYNLMTLSLSPQKLFVLSSALLAWGGWCVHFQTFDALNHAGLSIRTYLLGKGLHTLISTALACIIVPYLHFEVPCFTSGYSNVLYLSFSVLFSWGVLLFLKTTSGKLHRYHI